VNARAAGALALALALGVAGTACRGEGQAETGRAARRGPPFDAARAYALLQRQVAFGPRVPGTPGHAAQLAWMTDTLRALADTVAVQRFTHVTARGDTLRLANVFARFRPELPDRVLLVAHGDTRPTADNEPDSARRARPIPGANDGASGTAVLLELAHVLSSHSPPVGVDLLFVDGEDYGPESEDMYLGSKHFAANLPPGYRPLYGIVVDMVADRDPSFPVEAYSREYAPEVVDRVWRLAEELGYGHRFQPTTGGPVMDDHVPLNRAGIRTIDIIDFDYAHWHTLADDLPNTAPDGLEAVGTVLVELIYRGG